MDKRAESLAQADEEDFAFDLAKSANLGATAIMCRWREHAEDTLGKDNEITQHYQDQIDMLKEQHDLIWHGSQNAIAAAGPLAIEIKKKYGNKKQREISPEDHKRLYKPNEPR